MSAKVCVNYSGTATREKVEALRSQVANALGVLVEDVVILVNATISVVNVPDELTDKRLEKDTKPAEQVKLQRWPGVTVEDVVNAATKSYLDSVDEG